MSLLHEPTFKRLVGPAVFTKMTGQDSLAMVREAVPHSLLARRELLERPGAMPRTRVAVRRSLDPKPQPDLVANTKAETVGPALTA